MSSPTLLQVEDLAVVFDTHDARVEAVRQVSFDVAHNEFVGVVGESGSGKSVTARALMALVDRPGRIVSGTVRFEGTDILTRTPSQLRALRGSRIAMVFQDPMTSLNPVFTVGDQLRRVMRTHGTPHADARAAQLLRDVEIPAADKRLRQYPHELSGGMRQRVMIAMALANDPTLMIADEPTTALDVTVQAQILDLLARLRQERGMAIILISHSLDVVAEVADRVMVFYAGKVVETGTTSHVFGRPSHPYTRALIRSIPRGDRQPLKPLPGMPPRLSPAPVGCAFAGRCEHAFDRCREQPPLDPIARGHLAACWLSDRHVAVAVESR